MSQSQAYCASYLSIGEKRNAYRVIGGKVGRKEITGKNKT
jgi:hypothetical protein